MSDEPSEEVQKEIEQKKEACALLQQALQVLSSKDKWLRGDKCEMCLGILLNILTANTNVPCIAKHFIDYLAPISRFPAFE